MVAFGKGNGCHKFWRAASEAEEILPESMVIVVDENVRLLTQTL